MPAGLITHFILTLLISWGIWVPLALSGGSDQALLWLVVGLLWLGVFAVLCFDRRSFWPQHNADRHAVLGR